MITNASYMIRVILPLATAFAVGMTVSWQLGAPSAGASCAALQPGCSVLKSIGDWRAGTQHDPAFSRGLPSDAALAVCLAIKDQHEDIREVCLAALTPFLSHVCRDSAHSLQLFCFNNS